MHHNTFKFILVVLAVGFVFLFIYCVVVNIQLVGELPSRVYFLVLKLIVVEADSLEMNNKIVGQLGKESSFNGVSFLLTRVAHVV